MGQKINVAELLKDCPKGMELNCTMWDNVVFDHIDTKSDYPIYIKKMSGELECLTEDGCFNFNLGAKCVIYPKGKTTWEGFIAPYKFKDGDIVTWKDSRGSLVACVYKERLDISFSHHIALYKGGLGIIVNGEIISTNDELCLATEEEKEKLFDAIKENGYKWNADTKTLEKLPKFKIGDRVKKNKDYISGIVTDIFDDSFKVTYDGEGCSYVQFHYQDDWELVPDKFDVATLQPFDKVLVRGFDGVWGINIFGFYDGNNKECPFYCIGQTATGWNQCVPYWKNEHLLGTANDCDEYYKIWE